MAPGLLAVHAHADDETITMGGTFAHYASLGVRTANVCCTDGRLATIVDPTMVEEEVRPRLGEVRHAELTEACAILGVGELHWLGYHDSGMEGAASNREPDSFWMTPLDGIVERLVGPTSSSPTTPTAPTGTPTTSRPTGPPCSRSRRPSTRASTPRWASPGGCRSSTTPPSPAPRC